MKIFLILGLIALVTWLMMRPRPSAAERARTEARAVLGVGLKADADAIRAAHRRLLAEAHPDRGGSPEIARRLNEARDLLLKARR